MVFSIVIILFVAVIAYFHYVQGALAGLVSAVCAIVAALLAFSYHEQIAMLAFKQKMTDQGFAIALVGFFAIIYVILRTIFDNLIPGNVRFPAIVDKVGGAIFGLIAGTFAIGILTTAAETMPFGPAIGGYARYQLDGEREVKIPPTGHGQYADTMVFDELKSGDIKEEGADRMYLPADDILIGFVQRMSDGGSLEGERKLESVHPAYLDEMFFQRLGHELGVKNVLINTDKAQAFTVQPPIRFADALAQAPAEIQEIHAIGKDLKPIKSDPIHALLVVRISFADNAGDTDHFVRLAPPAVRIVANSKNYYPIGTLENGGVFANRPDDYLLIHAGDFADFVFSVDREDVLGARAGNQPGGAGMTIRDGVFIEIKRMARASLGGMPVEHGVKVEPSTGVQRKTGLIKPQSMVVTAPPPAPSAPATPAAPSPDEKPADTSPATPPADAAPAAPAAPAPPSASGPVTFVRAATGSKLFASFSVGEHGADAADLKFNSGSASIKEGKLQKFEIKPIETLDALAKGPKPVGELYAPSGTHVVIVTANAGTEAWLWAEHLSDFEVVDGSGISYKSNGALAKVTKDGKDYLVGNYNADDPVEKIEKQAGAPNMVAIIFLVPNDTPLKALNYSGQKMADLDVK